MVGSWLRAQQPGGRHGNLLRGRGLTNSDPHCDYDSYRDGYTNSHAHAGSNADGHGHSNSHAHAGSNADGHGHSNSYCNNNSTAFADAYSNRMYREMFADPEASLYSKAAPISPYFPVMGDR